MEIPKQLQKEGIKFVLLEKSGKKPFQKEWQKKEIFYDDNKLLNHIKDGGNYGVIGGGINELIIIDFDDESVQQDAIQVLPTTFTIKTGSGLLHKYYFSNKCDSFKVFGENLETFADIQGEGKQVVGAGSTHPNGNKYEVVDDSPIARIDYSEAKAIMMFFDKNPKNKENKIEIPKLDIEDDFLQLIKSKLSMSDVLLSLGIDITKNPTQCLLHDSVGGKCLGFTDEIAHCFHCDGSWNIFSLIKEVKKVSFKEALELLAKEAGLEDELKKARRDYVNNEAERIFSMKAQSEAYTDIQPIFYDRSGIWWLWDLEKHYWKITDEVDILNVIETSTGQDVITPGNRTKILNSLKQHTRKVIPPEIKTSWIQFDDEIYDFKTGEKFMASPKYFVTNPIPYKLGESSETPTMDKIFKEWVGKENVQLLYEIIAYCLIPDYPINRLFCFIGGGMNGKSKYLDLVRKFIGSNNCCSTELDTLLQSRFEITRLHKKLICMMGETNFNEMSKTSTLKKLTGGDLIGFEYKQKTPFEDKNYAKIIIATNNLPTTTDKTIGFYRRWLIIDFPNQFTEKKDILSEIPEEEYHNLSRKSLEILKGLMQKREFTNEGDVQVRMKRYEDKSNPLEKFLKENIEEDYDMYIFKWEFQKRLDEWCEANNYRKIGSVDLGKRMKEIGISQQLKTVGNLSSIKKWRVWMGLKWKS